MSRMFWRLIAPALFAASLATPAAAASFDCSKAQKPDEIAICGNSDISSLDSEMGGLWFAYDSFPFLMGMSGQRSDAAHKFLSDRGKCGANVTCLRGLYQARIKALKAEIQSAIGAFASANGVAPASSASLPEPVEGIVRGYGEECRRLGGTLAAGADRPSVMAADFDGDGALDYLLDPQPVECSAAATAFCGNGGCNIDIALSGRGYEKPIEVLGGQPTIYQGPETVGLEIWVDGSHCNVANYEKACWAAYSWKNGKAHQSYQARPLPKS